ncbi:type II toxin-antitoxin system HicA family toxin [Streptococcus infantarius]|nr:type II toxin-antitoxin system HicA family toxin [Streptococcus infantarius]
MKKNGWFKVRTEGSHEIYRHNDGRICPIKCTKKDIPSGTMTNIARITGLDF